MTARDSLPGLRERKKRRTRSTLIDVAAELCLQQGYDNTTVDQIASAADVSARTFSRYFPTKDAVIAAIADEVDEYVADALERQAPDITEHEALLRAHLEIFSPGGPVWPAAFNRMAVLTQIVNASPTLDAAAFGLSQGHANKAIVVLGARMGVSPDHLAVQLVADSWTVVFASALRGMGQPGNDPIVASVLCERMRAAFAVFVRTWSPWNVAEPRRSAGAELR